MREMQQGSPQEAARAAEQAAQAAAQNAVKAATDAANQALANAPQPFAPADLSKFSAPQLRRVLDELRTQRADIASRRSSIASTYEGASGVNREAIGGRLQIIDANITLFEADITRVGRELALKEGARGSFTERPAGGAPNTMSEEDAAGMAFGFSFMTLILAVFFTRRFMKRKYAGITPGMRQPQNLVASNERLERIEQAVDTIAVEVERVSENQRFMTRLMTETQLGDTLKDVRKSTELAKSAAEGSG